MLPQPRRAVSGQIPQSEAAAAAAAAMSGRTSRAGGASGRTSRTGLGKRQSMAFGGVGEEKPRWRG